ncbi:MAG: hypothetical protein HRT90_10040, partial [Candidatus Margulisbacteria bacterium]|nr:hypothetical protein [Candidatus Margulisiibacteriota bacterium]
LTVHSGLIQKHFSNKEKIEILKGRLRDADLTEASRKQYHKDIASLEREMSVLKKQLMLLMGPSFIQNLVILPDVPRTIDGVLEKLIDDFRHAENMDNFSVSDGITQRYNAVKKWVDTVRPDPGEPSQVALERKADDSDSQSSELSKPGRRSSIDPLRPTKLSHPSTTGVDEGEMFSDDEKAAIVTPREVTRMEAKAAHEHPEDWGIPIRNGARIGARDRIVGALGPRMRPRMRPRRLREDLASDAGISEQEAHKIAVLVEERQGEFDVVANALRSVLPERSGDRILQNILDARSYETVNNTGENVTEIDAVGVYDDLQALVGIGRGKAARVLSGFENRWRTRYKKFGRGETAIDPRMEAVMAKWIESGRGEPMDDDNMVVKVGQMFDDAFGQMPNDHRPENQPKWKETASKWGVVGIPLHAGKRLFHLGRTTHKKVRAKQSAAANNLWVKSLVSPASSSGSRKVPVSHADPSEMKEDAPAAVEEDAVVMIDANPVSTAPRQMQTPSRNFLLFMAVAKMRYPKKAVDVMEPGEKDSLVTYLKSSDFEHELESYKSIQKGSDTLKRDLSNARILIHLLKISINDIQADLDIKTDSLDPNQEVKIIELADSLKDILILKDDKGNIDPDVVEAAVTLLNIDDQLTPEEKAKVLIRLKAENEAGAKAMLAHQDLKAEIKTAYTDIMAWDEFKSILGAGDLQAKIDAFSAIDNQFKPRVLFLIGERDLSLMVALLKHSPENMASFLGNFNQDNIDRLVLWALQDKDLRNLLHNRIKINKARTDDLNGMLELAAVQGITSLYMHELSAISPQKFHKLVMDLGDIDGIAKNRTNLFMDLHDIMMPLVYSKMSRSPNTWGIMRSRRAILKIRRKNYLQMVADIYCNKIQGILGAFPEESIAQLEADVRDKAEVLEQKEQEFNDLRDAPERADGKDDRQPPVSAAEFDDSDSDTVATRSGSVIDPAPVAESEAPDGKTPGEPKTKPPLQEAEEAKTKASGALDDAKEKLSTAKRSHTNLEFYCGLMQKMYFKSIELPGNKHGANAAFKMDLLYRVHDKTPKVFWAVFMEMGDRQWLRTPHDSYVLNDQQKGLLFNLRHKEYRSQNITKFKGSAAVFLRSIKAANIARKKRLKGTGGAVASVPTMGLDADSSHLPGSTSLHTPDMLPDDEKEAKRSEPDAPPIPSTQDDSAAPLTEVVPPYAQGVIDKIHNVLDGKTEDGKAEDTDRDSLRRSWKSAVEGFDENPDFENYCDQLVEIVGTMEKVEDFAEKAKIDIYSQEEPGTSTGDTNFALEG